MIHRGKRDFISPKKPQDYRIVRGVGGNYWVAPVLAEPDFTPLQAIARGLFRKDELKPQVGDLVVCEKTFEELIPLRMLEIKERQNLLPRPPIANVSELWLLSSLTEPEPDFWLLDKMLAVAYDNFIPVRIIFTKADLIAEESALEVYELYKSLGYACELSALGSEETRERLLSFIEPGALICLAGASGVGKSTLLNSLLGEEIMPTGEISSKLGRGRHTTRHVELFSLEGAYIADTPGFSALDLAKAGVDGPVLAASYPEISDLQPYCRFTGCHHLSEPGCAVSTSTEIDPERLARYRSFREYLDNYQEY